MGRKQENLRDVECIVLQAVDIEAERLSVS
jgi:hypothetical protein